MPLQPLDKFLVQRGTVQYEMTADQLNDFINAGQDLTALSFEDLQNQIFIGGAEAEIDTKVFINDASGDPSVNVGFAIYRISSLSPYMFDKIQEGESLDIVINPTNLSIAVSPTGAIINNDNGNGFAIPLADTTNAGLQSPQDKANVHEAATIEAATPLTITGQEIGFDIAQLPPLP